MESLKQPLVSVIVPCYNHAQYLPDALQSVLQQTYSNWECIVVNDASTDNTSEVAAEWVQKDARFKLVVAEKNSGLAASRNLGIKHSTGEFLLPLDADDKIAKVYLELTVKIFLKNKDIKLVFTNTLCFGKLDQEVHFHQFSMYELCNNNQLNCTALFRRKDYDQTAGYRTNMIFGYEDWDFWMQLLQSNFQVHHLQMPLLLVRIKEQTMHTALTDDIFKESAMRLQLRMNNPNFYKCFAFEKNKKVALIKRSLKKIKNKLLKK